jgi:hypothetical protein
VGKVKPLHPERLGGLESMAELQNAVGKPLGVAEPYGADSPVEAGGGAWGVPLRIKGSHGVVPAAQLDRVGIRTRQATAAQRSHTSTGDDTEIEVVRGADSLRYARLTDSTTLCKPL